MLGPFLFEVSIFVVKTPTKSKYNIGMQRSGWPRRRISFLLTLLTLI